MRAMMLGLVLLVGCSSGSGSTEDAGPIVDAGGDVVVSMRWTWLDQQSPCDSAPVCAPACSEGSTTACECSPCANPNDCSVSSNLIEHCCAQVATILLSNVAQLVRDYPSCSLNQSSPQTYALDCGVEPVKVKSTPGVPFKYTTNCIWAPPYAIGPVN